MSLPSLSRYEHFALIYNSNHSDTSRPCIDNGSSLKASQPVSVRQAIASCQIPVLIEYPAALYSVGGIRTTFTIGVGAGGPAAYWSSYVVTCIFVMITAAMLSEICSALPAAGSIYFWAAEAGGKRYGRLFGFIVAWWSTTAWTTFIATNCQAAANFMLSEIQVFGLDFPTDTDDIRFRAVQWIVAEVILFLSLSANYLSPKSYSTIFRVAVGVILLDFFLNVIWLPIAVSKTYGFQDATYVFTQTYNNTGAPPVWNWMLSYFVTAGVLVGYEASGHISEETKDANLVAARGIFTSAAASALIGFPLVILFLFCLPDLDGLNALYELNIPQPFVAIYAMSMGNGHVFMNVVCIIGLMFNTTIAGVASSRLIWAVARDGVLPYSGWISQVSDKKEPRNAVIVMHVVAGLILCTILASPVAFTSLVSAAGVPTITAYALIAFGRVFLTPKSFTNARWSLGRWSWTVSCIALVWNTFLACVLFSPLIFPVTGDTFNYSPVIFAAITLFGVLTWYFTPESKWLPSARIGKVLDDDLAGNTACI
ncbi:amino acid permease [Dissoconium aciculare CBS 342.82]|uniref:Amino acid permease n=1 Tax=Dissoconium aciculare CBS 342.82 TaxID=1314786 RepID=A0A6J3MI42_9PEZI|nr:amino acid permease [Dissoconium aciculare CBS 342.82]KAF1827379.1 amino acid permease [Dissoconium aciculare CBS 342.82]